MSAVPARWRRVLHGYPGITGRRLEELAVLAAQGGRPGKYGWPLVDHIDYAGHQQATPPLVRHPVDREVWLGTAMALDALPEDVDAVVSLCLTGRTQVPSSAEQVGFRLIDVAEPEANENLEFVLADAARTVAQLRQEGKTVLVHCVAAHSRTPAVAAAYALLRGVPLGDALDDLLVAMPTSYPNPAFLDALSRLRGTMSEEAG
jgi:protein-tyrosine phosphatase